MPGSLVFSVGKKKLDTEKLCIGSSERKTRCWEAWYWQYGKKKLDARKLGIDSPKERTRCWEA